MSDYKSIMDIHRVDYFIYKGVVYGPGTVVKVRKEVIEKHYATKNGQEYIFKSSYNDGYNTFIPCVHNDEHHYMIRLSDYTNDIEDIIKPVYVELVPWQKAAFYNMLSGEGKADVVGGIIIYILVMVGSLIFNEWYLIWGFATLYFIFWLLSQYRK